MEQTQKDLPTKLSVEVVSWMKMAGGEILESIASHQIGQKALKIVDKILWIIEKSSQWSLSQPCLYERTKHESTSSELIRPLPWILFIPLLLYIRFLWEGISFLTLLIGEKSIKSFSVVKFIQKNRKVLRSIKNQGLRNMRNKYKDKSSILVIPVPAVFVLFVTWMLTVIHNFIRFPIVKYDNSDKSILVRKQSTNKIQNKNEDSNSKNEYSSKSDLNETIDISKTKIPNKLETNISDLDSSLSDASEKYGNTFNFDDNEEKEIEGRKYAYSSKNKKHIVDQDIQNFDENGISDQKSQSTESEDSDIPPKNTSNAKKLHRINESQVIEDNLGQNKSEFQPQTNEFIGNEQQSTLVYEYRNHTADSKYLEQNHEKKNRISNDVIENEKNLIKNQTTPNNYIDKRKETVSCNENLTTKACGNDVKKINNRSSKRSFNTGVKSKTSFG